jgi:hypothetical protein
MKLLKLTGPDEAGHEYAVLEVEGMIVQVKQDDDGVVVDIYAHDTANEPLNTMWVAYAEAEEAEADNATIPVCDEALCELGLHSFEGGQCSECGVPEDEGSG